jgi:hypothetical protein
VNVHAQQALKQHQAAGVCMRVLAAFTECALPGYLVSSWFTAVPASRRLNGQFVGFPMPQHS